MAKAQFHKNQKVWVEAVGCWATVERLVPVWSKGFDEPIRIGYDVGLGREFAAHELRAQAAADQAVDEDGAEWRLMRARNKWQSPDDCAHHPHPGTFPVVVTDRSDWGGWRVPGAEYDRDPRRIEQQARLIAAAPGLARIARELTAFVGAHTDDCPEELIALARAAGTLLRSVAEGPGGPPVAEGTRAAE